MKLFHKIFLCFVVIFSITFQVVGYLLINFAYENAIEQEKRLAFQNFQYNQYILLSVLYSEPKLLSEKKTRFADFSKKFTVPIAMCGADGTYLYSNLAIKPQNYNFIQDKKDSDIEDNSISYQIIQKNEENYIFVSDLVCYGDSKSYLITQTNISSVIETQRKMIAYFQKIYFIILCIVFPFIFLLTGYLTCSIKKVSKAAKKIATGRYSERIMVGGRDEISELADNFNQMAEQIEEKIAQLSDAARQKEDFTANFAHELKTPLTSVIGYADMLYQRDMPREQVKEAAGYIWNEGMRLEALSLKLMDLFVLDKQNFIFETISVQELFENIKQGIEPICQKQGVVFHMDLEEGVLKIDYDLFKTVILNLIDNAIKADCKDIWVYGEQGEGGYQICIKDNGKGIPPEELGRITEAFYMVDKSRARKQHGAGLGMALVSKIAAIHHAELEIKSDGKTGTEIDLFFTVNNG